MLAGGGRAPRARKPATNADSERRSRPKCGWKARGDEALRGGQGSGDAVAEVGAAAAVAAAAAPEVNVGDASSAPAGERNEADGVRLLYGGAGLRLGVAVPLGLRECPLLYGSVALPLPFLPAVIAPVGDDAPISPGVPFAPSVGNVTTPASMRGCRPNRACSRHFGSDACTARGGSGRAAGGPTTQEEAEAEGREADIDAAEGHWEQRADREQRPQ